MLPTIEGSGASSSPDSADGQMSITATEGDGWAPTSATAETASTTSTSGGVDGPSITFESANGHEIVLTYQDLVLLALLATAATAAWRGVQ